MRIAITCRFQNSYFSGALPQVAVHLGAALKALGHDVTLLRPPGDAEWFIDVETLKMPSTVWDPAKLPDTPYDLLIEPTWNMTAEQRAATAARVAMFVHYPPVMHDMESSVYPFNPLRRDFKGVSEIWTWDFYGEQDRRYLTFLSGGLPVRVLPFVANFDAVDAYMRETGVPAWMDTAAAYDERIRANTGVPDTLSWSARIVESNISNGSHCLLPLNIVSEIRRTVAPIRFSVHNGEDVKNNGFFQSNVAKNLVIPDISGSFVPRIRIPDLAREKSAIIAHQRWRPMKAFLLDALYVGIPVIHNCVLLKEFGYWYELNQIRDATKQWSAMMADYGARRGMFGDLASLRKRLRELWGSQRLEVALDALLANVSLRVEELVPAQITMPNMVSSSPPTLRIHFLDMWDQFQPAHNFFMSLFKWSGAQNGFAVELDAATPNLIVYGPFGDAHADQQWSAVPKIHFTGEHTPPRKAHNTFLNLGFLYNMEPDYIRLPLWVLEVNWFGEDPDAVVNPKPVPLAAALKQDPAILDAKQKFCAFVATNPRNQSRNNAFHVLNEWRGVDAGGRLFCNLPGGPIPAGLGGGGGELAKVEFYKSYKYAITFENVPAQGYTTEKIFHAKVAGCVPIYWGDEFVDRDFDARGFLNANVVQTPSELCALVERLEADPEAWRRAAEVPALTEYKRHWCERTMEQVVRQTVRRVLNLEAQFAEGVWDSAVGFHASQTVEASEAAQTAQTIQTTQKANAPKLILTAANKRFVPSVRLLVDSIRHSADDAATPIHIWLWPDVGADERKMLTDMGATLFDFPTTETVSWPDFWDPQHFAWKLWLHDHEAKHAAPGSLILYLDSGIDVVSSLANFWNQIDREDMCVIEDDDHTEARWCHPTFCEALAVTAQELATKQIWAGCFGFKAGGRHASIHAEALRWAKQRRDVIVGEKWRAYTDVCKGHRHDQSLLGILTQRARVPRLSIKSRDVYCDRARRTAEQWGTPLYVHRGAPRLLQALTPGIDEAYVINLERRADRLAKFKQNAHLKDHAYVWRATDGRTLKMTAPLAALFRDNDFKWKKSVMGCALSHLGLWEKLARDAIARSYLIMEDDVKFADDWLAKWMVAAPHIPANADVIYLGGVLPPNKEIFKQVADPVNAHFAKVAPNQLFGGPSPRRYFHFCNYAYILTRQGAQKMMGLVGARGIFTSGDHMIVNHGDELLNIYFTTPLLATCIQEDDPVYQRSEFNNFDRLDAFDSDLWNNNDHFTGEEITPCLAELMKSMAIKVVNKPISDAERSTLEAEHAAAQAPQPPSAPITQTSQTSQTSQTVPVPSPPQTKEAQLKLWNDFMRAVALKRSDAVKQHLAAIFAMWSQGDQLLQGLSWFRVFEQLILTGHPEMLACREAISEFIHRRDLLADKMWEAIVKHLGISNTKSPTTPGIPVLHLSQPHKSATRIHHWIEKNMNPSLLMEREWLGDLFPNGIAWQQFENPQELIDDTNARVLLYQNPPGIDRSPALKYLLDALQAAGRQITLLHLSDEFAVAPIVLYEHPAVKHVLRNYWRHDLPKSMLDRITVLPLGYTPGRHALGLGPAPNFKDRSYIWSFAGSLDRPGRLEALTALRDVEPHLERTIMRWGDKPALDAHGYCDAMRRTKFVPCMSGSCALESFRVYEALEHGAIPVYVPAESNGTTDEFREMYGSDHPFLPIPSWEAAPALLKQFAAADERVMEEYRQRCLKWWAAKKTALMERIKALVQ